MSTLFTVGSGSAYLTVVSAASGVTLEYPNPDLSQSTLTLTFSQARQLAVSIASILATNGTPTPTVAGAMFIGTTPNSSPGGSIAQVTAVTLTLPLSGTAAGQIYTQSLTAPTVAQQLVNALLLYVVTSGV